MASGSRWPERAVATTVAVRAERAVPELLGLVVAEPVDVVDERDLHHTSTRAREPTTCLT